MRKPSHLFGFDVEAGDGVAAIGKSGARDKTDVSRAYNRNPHTSVPRALSVHYLSHCGGVSGDGVDRCAVCIVSLFHFTRRHMDKGGERV